MVEDFRVKIGNEIYNVKIKKTGPRQTSTPFLNYEEIQKCIL